ncbi:MAG: alpha-amylase family glycosyl hydrolase, partial [Nitriliruptorales bacterium]|nr:alpha-amylase family glycosyl hydrolase [Nitriliruptorales bacterium]
FYFPALRTDWDAEDIRSTLRDGVEAGEGALSWPLSSHDDPHAAERFGGGEVGARRARAYFALFAGLPGIPFLYMGDELGLDNGELREGEFADPVTTRNEGQKGRDGSRTPMLWEPEKRYGFTTGQPWLPFGVNRHPEQSAAAQEDDPSSHLHAMRELLRVRRALPDLVGDAPVEWIGSGPVVGYRRGSTVVACNVSSERAEVDIEAAEIHLTTGIGASAEIGEGGMLVVPSDSTVYARVTVG